MRRAIMAILLTASFNFLANADSTDANELLLNRLTATFEAATPFIGPDFSDLKTAFGKGHLVFDSWCGYTKEGWPSVAEFKKFGQQPFFVESSYQDSEIVLTLDAANTGMPPGMTPEMTPDMKASIPSAKLKMASNPALGSVIYLTAMSKSAVVIGLIMTMPMISLADKAWIAKARNGDGDGDEAQSSIQFDVRTIKDKDEVTTGNIMLLNWNAPGKTPYTCIVTM